MKKVLYILIISVFAGSCGTSKNKPKANFMDKYQKRILGNVIGLNRLELSSSFDECGEWGGHNEKFDIYREDKILYAKYTEDIIDCNNPYDKNRKIAEIKIIKLNENHEKAIVKYLKSLVDNSLKMKTPFHAGTHYQALMNDSTLVLNYHNFGSGWKEYIKLKKELNN